MTDIYNFQLELQPHVSYILLEMFFGNTILQHSELIKVSHSWTGVEKKSTDTLHWPVQS